MRRTNLSASAGVVQRSQRDCSTPQSSGNSERTGAPPRAARRSAVWPMAGLAEMPEKPSEPPHSTPTMRSEMGQAWRVWSLAWATVVKVVRMESLNRHRGIPTVDDHFVAGDEGAGAV